MDPGSKGLNALRPAIKNKSTDRVLLFMIFASVLLSPGCAMLTRNSEQRIPVTSSPVGAAVIVNGIWQGVTPLVIKRLRWEKGHVIRIESPGYCVRIRCDKASATRLAGVKRSSPYRIIECEQSSITTVAHDD